MDQCLQILSCPKKIVRENVLPILCPVLLYIFCDPNHHSHVGCVRAGLLDTLLGMARKKVLVSTFLVETMDWFQMDNKASLPDTARYMC